jgi:hypothetical protein
LKLPSATTTATPFVPLRRIEGARFASAQMKQSAVYRIERLADHAVVNDELKRGH